MILGEVECRVIPNLKKENLKQDNNSLSLNRSKRELNSIKFDFYPQDGSYKIPYESDITGK